MSARPGDVAEAPAGTIPAVGISPTSAYFVLAFWVVCITISTAWFFFNPAGFWLMTGGAACFVVSVPLASKNYDLISPWTLVLGAVYISCGLRGLFLSLDIEGSRSTQALFLLGNSPEAYYLAAVLFMIGLGGFTAAYMLAGLNRRPRVRIPFGFSKSLDPGRTTVAVLACAFIGFVAFLIFARSTGGLDLTSISAKRTTINGTNLSSDYQSFGISRVLASLAGVAFWVQLAAYCTRGQRHGLGTWRGVWVLVLFLNAVLLPIYASSRATLAEIIFGAIVIEVCLAKTRVRPRALVAVALVAIVSLSWLTMVRAAHGDRTSLTQLNFQTLGDTFVLTRTFSDVAGTGNIINAVPNKLPYANGSTITAWLFAPIPRSVWPTKPIISAGPQVGFAVYGSDKSGVPPGLVAESYWNFGTLGVFILPLVCGWAIRRFHDMWSPFTRASPAATLVIISVTLPAGLDIMSGSIGSAPFQAVERLVLLVPILLFISSRGEMDGRRGLAQPTRVSSDPITIPMAARATAANTSLRRPARRERP